jgi:hypothetical protein
MRHVSKTGWVMKLRRLFICAVILLLGMLSPLYAVEEAPFITDDEEYTVIAATFSHESIPFAIKSTKEKTSNNDTSRPSQHLSGIPSNYFNLSRLTTKGSISDKSLDPAMVDDFNRKNAQPHQIDPEKFAAATKGSNVTLIDPKGFSMEEEPRGIRSGTTYISRPGFNKARTGAVLNVSHVADPEMGIGYQVTFEKSPQDGKWYIVDAVVNRRY